MIKEGSTITLNENDEILYDNRIIKHKLPKNPPVFNNIIEYFVEQKNY